MGDSQELIFKLESQLAQAEQNGESLGRQVEQLKSDLEVAKKESRKEEAEKESQKQEVTHLEAEVARLRAEEAEKESQKEEVTHLQADVARLRAEEAQKGSRKEEVTHLQAEVARLRMEEAEKGNRKEEITHLQAEVARLEAEVNDLNEKPRVPFDDSAQLEIAQTLQEEAKALGGLQVTLEELISKAKQKDNAMREYTSRLQDAEAKLCSVKGPLSAAIKAFFTKLIR